jgi:hypothetical protein
MKSDHLNPHPTFPQSICPLLWLCANKEHVCVCVCALSIMASPAHVAKFSMHESYSHQSQTSYQGLHLSGPQIGGNLRVLDEGCRVDGVTLFNQIL